MFSFGFIGWILTYYLSNITEKLANPSEWLTFLFYIISFALIVGGIINDLKKKGS